MRHPPTVRRGAIFLLAGIACLAASVWLFLRKDDLDELAARGERVQGEVTNSRVEYSGSVEHRSKIVHAQVRFTTLDGESISGEARVDEIDNDRFEAASPDRPITTNVVYRPDRPHSFVFEQQLTRRRGRSIEFWVTAIVGFLLTVSGSRIAYTAATRRTKS